jgi:hypothetical protein
MTINEHQLYWSQGFLQQQNHQRVLRLLREMQYTSHADRRGVQQQPANDRREESSVVSRWTDRLWQTLH